MSWTSIDTAGEAITLTRAEQTRHSHTPIRRGLRKICAACRNRWGRYGCALHLWATHVLSRMSRIIVPNPPPRPKRRHHPRYIELVAQGAAQARSLYRTPRPHPG